MSSDPVRSAARWTDAVFLHDRSARIPARRIVAVLPGEGIGPEVVAAALRVLSAVEASGADAPFDVRTGGPIGRDAELLSGRALTDEVVEFCADAFQAGGAV